MPVLLNNALATSKKSYTPKFFSSHLTGSGGMKGILSRDANPSFIDPDVHTSDYLVADKASVSVNGRTTVRKFPVDVFPVTVWQDMETLPINKAEAVKIGSFGNDSSLYVQMDVHSLIISETTADKNVKNVLPGKTLTTAYRVFFFAEVDPSEKEYLTDNCLFAYARAQDLKDNTVAMTFWCNPRQDAPAYLASMKSRGFVIDQDAFDQYVLKYSTYDHVCRMSNLWQTKMSEIGEFALSRLSGAVGKGAPVNIRTSVYDFIAYLSTYAVSLDAYQDIFNSVRKYFPNMVDQLCEDNLDLLLNDCLYKLGQKKSSPVVPAPNDSNVKKQNYNREQMDAITEPSNLALIQAGAGTGKSTVVLGRIQYMIDSGVKPEDIMVLSFSNAAADNIVERNPEVHSQTIASMLKEIYDLNYPGQEISGIQTLRNSLAIWFPGDNDAYRFSQILWEMKDSKPGAYTKLNSFVKHHFDKVMEMLNTVGQTCFELQIIVCYQKIDSLIEPDDIKSRHLIIDEVQDNSIFEFVFALEYVRKHNESLFIVGDSSQTLYEFRGSDPRALNMLEHSGVFTTHKLELNYRSNQNVLDFANVLLETLENNQFANIRLKANVRIKVTKDSFRDAVQLHYYDLRRAADLHDKLTTVLNGDAKKFIDDAYAKNEQVAFLAFGRKDVYKMQEIIEKAYPNAETACLIPEKAYETTFFSSFVKRFWDEVEFLPVQNLMGGIAQTIISHFDDLQRTSAGNRDAKLREAQGVIREWTRENAADVNDAVMEYLNGTIGKDEMYTRVKMTLINFEIVKNAAKSNAVTLKNNARKENQSVKNANFVFSTIHSAKGLEFDHVVLLYKDNDNKEESNKRAYYVGLTRAKMSEFIIAYDVNRANADIKIAFDDLIDALPAV